MYVKDKNNRITLRLNDEQFTFVKNTADMLGVSPSEFLRMVVNATMSSTSKAEKTIKGDIGRENDKTDIDHIL